MFGKQGMGLYTIVVIRINATKQPTNPYLTQPGQTVLPLSVRPRLCFFVTDVQATAVAHSFVILHANLISLLTVLTVF